MKDIYFVSRAKKIKLLLMDVDGVLTDGKMYSIPGLRGGDIEIKGFSSLDGIGLRLLRNFGVTTGLITGRRSHSTMARARNLCMRYVYQGFLSKVKPLEDIAAHAGVKFDEIAYIGDDLTDIPVMRKVGLACAPANSVNEVLKTAHFRTKRNGGDGAVREVCDLILKSRGHWPAVMKLVDEAAWEPMPKEEIIVVEDTRHH